MGSDALALERRPHVGTPAAEPLEVAERRLPALAGVFGGNP